MENDKLAYYIATINQTFLRLKEVNKDTNENIEKRIDQLKPPVFWKDKSVFVEQAKLWNTKKINYILNLTYNLEIIVKSNAQIDKKIVVRKLLIDICSLANAA